MTTNTALLTALTQKHLPPTKTWLTTYLASQKPSTPLAALTHTALYRLLASDITTTLSTTSSSSSSSSEPCAQLFPADINDGRVRERRVEDAAVVAQVRGWEDLGRGRLEELRGLEEGEGRGGRVVVGIEGEGAGGGKVGPVRVLLEDAGGGRVWGVEVRGVEGLGPGMGIGCKVLVRGFCVARGVVLLEPGVCMVLGGRVEGLERAWREGRKGELRRLLEGPGLGG